MSQFQNAQGPGGRAGGSAAIGRNRRIALLLGKLGGIEKEGQPAAPGGALADHRGRKVSRFSPRRAGGIPNKHSEADQDEQGNWIVY
jgi:hypothetical protein